MLFLCSLNLVLLVTCLLPVLSTQEQVDGDESKISYYLRHYKGPNSEQLKQFYNYQPSLSYISSEAQNQAYAIYKDLSNAPALANGDLSVTMKIFDTLQDTSRSWSVIHDNSQDESDLVVVSSTHGFWILKIDIRYGQRIYEEYDADVKSKNLKKNRNKLLDSPIFKSRIERTVLLKGPGAAVDNFDRFLYQLYVAGGKITHILTIAKKEFSRRKLSINSSILAAIRRYIHVKAQRQERIDPSSLQEFDITWSDDVSPFNRPHLRTFFAAFYYYDEAQKWVSLSMYGPALGIFSLSATEIAREDGIPNGLWVETKQLEPSADNTAAFRIVTWGEVDQSSELSVGFQNDPTDVPGLVQRNPGVAIMLLTSKGFLLVWYPSALFHRIVSHTLYDTALRSKTQTDLREKLREAVREFHDAQGLRIITLASTVAKSKEQEEKFLYKGAFLDRYLSIVQEETMHLFQDKNNLEMTGLILGDTRLTGAQQRFIIQAVKMGDQIIVAIYYDEVLQFTISMDGSREIESHDPLKITAKIGDLHTTKIETNNDVMMLDC